MHREVEVHDVRDTLDVDAARGDVGRDEHARAPALERLQRLGALALAAVRVNRRRDDAGVLQLARDLVGAVFRAREDEHEVERLVAEQVDQQIDLAALRNGIEELRDRFRGIRAAPDLDGLRRAEELGGDALDVGRERRREEQRLALARQRAHDAADLRQEAHVEHAVGFIEHRDLDVAERDVAGAHEVEQAAGRGDDDVDAAAHRRDLRGLADAAEDGGAADVDGLAEQADLLLDLRRELARRRDDERARSASVRRLAHEPLEDGQHERRGLAGARLRDPDQIAPFENLRNRRRLDRRRHGVARIGDGLEKLFGQIESTERQCSGFLCKLNCVFGNAGGEMNILFAVNRLRSHAVARHGSDLLLPRNRATAQPSAARLHQIPRLLDLPVDLFLALHDVLAGGAAAADGGVEVAGEVAEVAHRAAHLLTRLLRAAAVRFRGADLRVDVALEVRPCIQVVRRVHVARETAAPRLGCALGAADAILVAAARRRDHLRCRAAPHLFLRPRNDVLPDGEDHDQGDEPLHNAR